MGKVKVAAFSISVDGFGAGPGQDLEHPLGVRGLELHGWFFETEAFNRIHGRKGGVQGIDNEAAAKSFDNVGAWILGRNMFGPVRGPWKDESWKGWWGNNPPVGQTLAKRPCMFSCEKHPHNRLSTVAAGYRMAECLGAL